MVILSVGLVTLSATAARIHGIRLKGTTVASVRAAPVGAAVSVAAIIPGSKSCQRSSAATTAESDPSASNGSSCGKPKAFVVTAAVGGAARASSRM